jgi:hypothetical protein
MIFPRRLNLSDCTWQLLNCSRLGCGGSVDVHFSFDYCIQIDHLRAEFGENIENGRNERGNLERSAGIQHVENADNIVDLWFVRVQPRR